MSPQRECQTGSETHVRSGDGRPAEGMPPNPAPPLDPVVVIGAGPAGLTAAYELDRAGLHTVVLEKDVVVGGISRTVRYRGYGFDVGGHRFFTKVEAVERMWREVLGDELLRRPRLSRILYRGRYFDYPLRARNVLRGLGLTYALRALTSYAAARLNPRIPERTLEDWVINRFGERLYRMFFKTYTEKVWGIPCSEIGADWAAQRIRGLSLSRAVVAALIPSRSRGIKSLIDAFYYPRLGPGQMWEAVRDRLETAGRPVLTGTEVVRVLHTGGRAVEVHALRAGEAHRVRASHVVSSMPLRELVEILDPHPPPHVLAAAQALRYRDFLQVALIVNQPHVFPDTWLYIHDPAVRVGRIQNFGNWSPDMVPEEGRSCLGFEYFCFAGDELWTMQDEQLVDLARREAAQLRLFPEESVLEGVVVRMPKAYPVYDAGYAENIDVLRAYFAGLSNLHPVGRNGLHRYNNQDHSMFTAMLAVRNILGAHHDVWSVNADCEYHEEIADEDLRARRPTSGHVGAPPRLVGGR
jgi:protoporphyrinogen oxidase